MYYFYVQFANGNAYLVQVERCGDVADAEREARRMMNAYTDFEDFAIKKATVEDIVSQLNFVKNIALLR